jgi:hypothetical protein
MEMLVFLSFVIVRAFHPVVIDASKRLDESTGRKIFHYQTSSTVILTTCLLAAFSLIFCLFAGGRSQFASVFEPKPLFIFSINGFVYLLGDYLEMASLGSLRGAAYQILMQSRIILTAAILVCAKGINQTRLQWILLTILMLAMSAYMVILFWCRAAGR